MRTHSETVSFRADQDILKIIDAEASRFGISRGSWVRGIVIAHAHRLSEETGGLNAAEERFDAIVEALDSLGDNIAISLYYLLVHAGGLSQEQAKDLVRSKLTQKGTS